VPGFILWETCRLQRRCRVLRNNVEVLATSDDIASNACYLITDNRCITTSVLNKKFELMLTRRAKAYSSSGSVVTHRSTNRARRRVTSFQSKRVTNYATPPTPVPWRHLVNDIDLCSPKYLKSLTPACAGLHEPRGSGLRLLKSTFNAENFIRRLSWSNSSHFVAIQHLNVRSIQILWKIH